MPDTQNRFKRLRLSINVLSASDVTNPTVTVQLWNADAGPDGNIHAGDQTTLPDLFQKLGFEVHGFTNTQTDFL